MIDHLMTKISKNQQQKFLRGLMMVVLVKGGVPDF